MWGLVWDTMKWLALNISLQGREGGQGGCTPRLAGSPAAVDCKLWLQLHLARMQCWGSLQACIAHPSSTNTANALLLYLHTHLSPRIDNSSSSPPSRQRRLPSPPLPAPPCTSLQLNLQEGGCAKQAFSGRQGGLAGWASNRHLHTPAGAVHPGNAIPNPESLKTPILEI